MWELRLGDEIDDYCIKCRRLTNHSIVSMVDAKAAKVRCRTCYSDHDFRNEQAPPSKKELARQKELFNAVLAGVADGHVTRARFLIDPEGVLRSVWREDDGDEWADPARLLEEVQTICTVPLTIETGDAHEHHHH